MNQKNLSPVWLALALLAIFTFGSTTTLAQAPSRGGLPSLEGILGWEPVPQAGSCFEDHAGTGCDDAACEAEVCGIDGFCCDTVWDGICVTEAFALCGIRENGDRATFAVYKTFEDGNPNDVEVTLSCNTGLPIEQSKVISPGIDNAVVFVVTNYDDGEMDCEVTEAVPNGYLPTYENGFAFVSSDVSCEWDDLPWGAQAVCEITNTPDAVQVDIEKVWVVEGSGSLDGVSDEYRIDLWCDSEILGGSQYGQQWHQWWWGSGDDSFSALVVPAYPYSNCYVTESVLDSAVEVDNGCGNFQVSVANGYECTITNTVFFEGVPTLGHYGLAALALLMLGVGWLGFRRLT